MQFAKNVIHKFTFTLPFTKTRLELVENEIFVFIWKFLETWIDQAKTDSIQITTASKVN